MAGTIILEKIKSTEKIVRQIEAENTLVFVTARSVTKEVVKKEAEKLFDVKVEKVRSKIQNNKKIVYIKLKADFLAADVATKLGIM